MKLLTVFWLTRGFCWPEAGRALSTWKESEEYGNEERKQGLGDLPVRIAVSMGCASSSVRIRRARKA